MRFSLRPCGLYAKVRQSAKLSLFKEQYISYFNITKSNIKSPGAKKNPLRHPGAPQGRNDRGGKNARAATEETKVTWVAR